MGTGFTEDGIFKEALDDLKVVFGLELSLIEQVRLKRDYVIPVLKEREQIEYVGENGFDPNSEAIVRFLHDYYGTLEIDSETMQELRVFHHEEFCEYLRRIQERAHLP